MDPPAEHLEGLPSDAKLAAFECVTRFGWTLSETRSQPAADTRWLLAIARTRDDAERENHDRSR